MIDKIWGLVSIYYPLQNSNFALLSFLSNKYTFWDPDLDKIWSYINLSYLYFMISLCNTLIKPNR